MFVELCNGIIMKHILMTKQNSSKLCKDYIVKHVLMIAILSKCMESCCRGQRMYI